MALKQFPRHPEIINAIQFQGSLREIEAAVKDPTRIRLCDRTTQVHVKSDHGWIVVEQGDWIIQKDDGELYPCKNDSFRKLANTSFEAPAHLPDHMKRVFMEVKLLDENLAKLGAYLANGGVHSSPVELELQQQQFDFMDGYSKSLHKRLALYKQ